MNRSVSPSPILFNYETFSGSGFIGWDSAACGFRCDINTDRIFCMNVEGLLEARSAIQRKDPIIQTSFIKLRMQADRALVAGPFSVIQKNKIPPSGDKHDYMRVPPYAGTGDGLTNPDWWLDYDRVPLEKLTQSVETLALAYFFYRETGICQQGLRIVTGMVHRSRYKDEPGP